MLPWPARDADASQVTLRGAMPTVGVTVKEATGRNRIMATSVRRVLTATGTGDGGTEGVVLEPAGIALRVTADITGLRASRGVVAGEDCT